VLIPKLRDQRSPAMVHLLTYSAPIAKKMLHFSDLAFYSLPSLPRGHVLPHWITIELGIFAGRLYMTFEQCEAQKHYIETDSDGKRSEAWESKIVNFLVDWLALRRRGQDIMHTPMGYICQGRPLDREHAFFVVHGNNDRGVVRLNGINGTVDQADQDDSDEELAWSDMDGGDPV